MQNKALRIVLLLLLTTCSPSKGDDEELADPHPEAVEVSERTNCIPHYVRIPNGWVGLRETVYECPVGNRVCFLRGIRTTGTLSCLPEE